MMTFYDLAAIAKEILCFIFLILSFWSIVNILLSFHQKKWNYGVISIPFLFLSYALVYGLKRADDIDSIRIEFLNQVPLFVYILLIVIILGANIFILIKNILWNIKHINQVTYKEALDLLPAGLCYYKSDGLLVLKNHMMNQIAYEITHKVLLNGKEFYNQIKEESIYELKDMVVKFRFSEFMVDDIKIYEIIADDITELYDKTKRLKNLNEEMKKTNERMKESSKTTLENIKRQEILDTKVRIHDDFNQLVLTSLNAIDSKEKKKILKRFKENILILSEDSKNEAASNTLSDIYTLAKLIGLQVEFIGNMDSFKENELTIIVQASKEIMVNAKKHGNANRVYIAIDEDLSSYYIHYKNDGIRPSAIKPLGGLKNIMDSILIQNGKMEIYNDKDFEIILTLRKDDSDV